MATNMNRIRELREKVGLSQTRLACLVGLAASNLSNIETGKWPPWPKVRAALARALGVTEEELFPSGKKDGGQDGE